MLRLTCCAGHVLAFPCMRDDCDFRECSVEELIALVRTWPVYPKNRGAASRGFNAEAEKRGPRRPDRARSIGGRHSGATGASFVQQPPVGDVTYELHGPIEGEEDGSIRRLEAVVNMVVLHLNPTVSCTVFCNSACRWHGQPGCCQSHLRFKEQQSRPR